MGEGDAVPGLRSLGVGRFECPATATAGKRSVGFGVLENIEQLNSN
jgi:hypothetical protein